MTYIFPATECSAEKLLICQNLQNHMHTIIKTQNYQLDIFTPNIQKLIMISKSIFQISFLTQFHKVQCEIGIK